MVVGFGRAGSLVFVVEVSFAEIHYCFGLVNNLEGMNLVVDCLMGLGRVW